MCLRAPRYILAPLRRPTAFTQLAHRRLAPVVRQLSSIPTPTAATMPPTPKTQTAIVINKQGGPEVMEVWQSAPVPTPTAGQLLVKNEYTGCNYIDTYFRTGLYPVPAYPYTLGREGEGTVVAAGADVSGFAPGDRVCFVAGGSFAEYVAVNASHAAKVPDGLAPGVAAASMIQGLTALTLVRESYAVQKGDKILVHAAAGGVGLWLCQLLRTIGAETIATASSDAKLALAAEHGATHLVNYAEKDWVAEVQALTGGQGVAAVFDGVGAATFDGDLQVLARKGSLLSFGNASGAVPPVKLTVLGPKNLRLMRPGLMGYIVTQDEFRGYAGELLALLKDGKVRVNTETYPLADAAKAQADLESRKTTGKLLLKI